MLTADQVRSKQHLLCVSQTRMQLRCGIGFQHPCGPPVCTPPAPLQPVCIPSFTPAAPPAIPLYAPLLRPCMSPCCTPVCITCYTPAAPRMHLSKHLCMQLCFQCTPGIPWKSRYKGRLQPAQPHSLDSPQQLLPPSMSCFHPTALQQCAPALSFGVLEFGCW